MKILQFLFLASVVNGFLYKNPHFYYPKVNEGTVVACKKRFVHVHEEEVHRCVKRGHMFDDWVCDQKLFPHLSSWGDEQLVLTCLKEEECFCTHHSIQIEPEGFPPFGQK